MDGPVLFGLCQLPHRMTYTVPNRRVFQFFSPRPKWLYERPEGATVDFLACAARMPVTRIN